MAVASARMSLIVRFCLPRWTAFRRFGMAIAARMPMIAMTISSSIRVKPDSRFFICSSVRFPEKGSKAQAILTNDAKAIRSAT